MKLDTVIRIASSTKLVTSIAAMQCVERGLLGLDQDVVDILPELKHLGVLVNFDANGKPITETVTQPITLRLALRGSIRSRH